MQKKKLNKKDFRFRKVENETLVKKPGQINGIDFNCRFLKNCTVYLCDVIAAIYVDDCEDCTFYIGPVTSSIFMRDCKNCSLSVAAAQIRISDSNNIKLYSFCQSDPTLEQVDGLEVAPYNFQYPKIGEHFEMAKLNVNNDRWNQVADFTKNEDDSHWKVLTPADWPGMHVKEFDDIEGSTDVPTKLPTAYGGDLDVDIYAKHEQEDDEANNPGGMKSFAIGTDEQQAWNTLGNAQNQDESGPVGEENQDNNDFLVGGDSTEQFQQNNTFQNSGTQETGLLGGPPNPEKNAVDSANFSNPSNTMPIINNSEPEDPLLVKQRAREAERQNKLQELYAKEVEAKKERRAAAQKYLQEYMANHKQSLLEKRQANQNNNNGLSSGANQHGQSWQLVKNNIAQKAGDYPGTQNVDRIRESILNKAADGTD